MYKDEPKMLQHIDVLNARLAQVNEPHVKPLTKFVDQLRVKIGEEATIPYFDPWDGGVNSDILFLLEAPGSKAVNSGFISRNNNDETAKNFFMLSKEANIDRKRSILWNVVPWYIGSGQKIRPANSKDLRQGLEPLSDLIKLLPDLRVVALLGKKAQKANPLISKLNASLRIVCCPHPSPLFVNNAPENRDIIQNCFKDAKEMLD